MLEESRDLMVSDATFDGVIPGLVIRALGELGASITQHSLANQAMATIIVDKEGRFVLQADGLNGPGLVLFLPALKLQSPNHLDVKVTRVRIVRRTKRAAIGDIID